MDRSKYPPEWEEIAHKVKERAGWKCERCATPHGRGDGKRILTTHHIDHDPQNNSSENLAALCDKCHLDDERKWQRSAKGKQRQIRFESPPRRIQPRRIRLRRKDRSHLDELLRQPPREGAHWKEYYRWRMALIKAKKAVVCQS